MLKLLTTLVPTNQAYGAHRTDPLRFGLTPGSSFRTLARRCKEERSITLADRMLEPVARRNVLELQRSGGRRIDLCGGHSASVGWFRHHACSPSGDDSSFSHWRP